MPAPCSELREAAYRSGGPEDWASHKHAATGREVLCNCPHSNDLTNYDGRGCRFQGNLSECAQHVEVCPYEAAEVRHLADSMAHYLRRHRKNIPQAVALVKEAVQRVETGALDEQTVTFIDGEPRKVVVRGLLVEPMQRRLFGHVADMTNGSESTNFLEFLNHCLPGFEVVRIPFYLQKGEYIIEGMLSAHLREGPGGKQIDDETYVPYEHSSRVWSLAIASAELAATNSVEMKSSKTPTVRSTSPSEKNAAKVLKAIGARNNQIGSLGKVLKAFKSWDADGNGSISKSELIQVMHSLDNTLSPDDLDKLFSAADVNKDAGIDYNEFVEWLYH